MTYSFSEKRKRPVRKLLFYALVFFAVLILSGGLYAKSYYDRIVKTPNPGTAAQVIVEVELGSSLRQIAQYLHKQQLIQDPVVFEIYVRLHGLEKSILAGTYETKGNRTLPEILEDLQLPVSTEVTITIPEGIRYTQIADRLDAVMKISPNWSKEDFLVLAKSPGDKFSQQILKTKPRDKSLEGFLFPDTYTFSIEASTADVINIMLNNAQNRIDGQLLADIEASPFDVYETLNFAAMLERETILKEDRHMVADIMIRRLDAGWPLGIDATILYEHDSWKYLIRQKDIDTATPYNTRINKGLPPTPIANPGLEAIRGVVYPSPNDFWYYISDSDGNMYYAETWSQHKKNIQDHLR